MYCTSGKKENKRNFLGLKGQCQEIFVRYTAESPFHGVSYTVELFKSLSVRLGGVSYTAELQLSGEIHRPGTLINNFFEFGII